MRAKEFLHEVDANVAKVQSNIVDKVNTIFDIDELNQIYSYVRKIDLGTGFEPIFSKDEDLKQIQGVLSRSIIDAKATFEEKLEFAKEMATTGIIDINQLLTPGVKQNLQSVVKTNFPNIFKQIASDILNISGSFLSGTKKTNRGKGEFFLAIASPFISMAKGAGDLDINTGKNSMAIEVKADLGRLKGRKGYGTTDTAYREIKSNSKLFLKNNIKEPEGQVNKQHPDFIVTLGAKSNFWSQFGPYCIQHGVDPGLVSSFIKSQLEIVVRSLYINLDRESMDSMLTSVDETTGVVDFKALSPAVKVAAFTYYQQSDGFDGLLLINGDSLNFMYIPDATTFQQSARYA